MGYPEGGGTHPIITVNDVWVGTLVDAAAAHELAQFMSILAATPAENLGYAPLEEVNQRVRATFPSTTPAADEDGTPRPR